MKKRAVDRLKASFAAGIVTSSLLLVFGFQGTAAAGQTVTAASDQAINIVNAGASYAFSPVNVTVPVGTVITWPNQTAVRHFIYNTVQHTFDQNVEPGATGTWNTAGQPTGVYPYICILHPAMGEASITLVAPTPTPTATPTPPPSGSQSGPPTATPPPTPTPTPTPPPTVTPPPTPTATPTQPPTPGPTSLPDVEFELVEVSPGKYDIEPPSATVALGQRMVWRDTTNVIHFIQREDHANDPFGPGHQTLWFQGTGRGEELTLTYVEADRVAGLTLVLECVIHSSVEYGGPMETVVTITGEGGPLPTQTDPDDPNVPDITLPPTDASANGATTGGSGLTALAILILAFSSGLGALSFAVSRARIRR
jgi:plastocyanin